MQLEYTEPELRKKTSGKLANPLKFFIISHVLHYRAGSY
jgi:hypothetical protein